MTEIQNSKPIDDLEERTLFVMADLIRRPEQTDFTEFRHSPE